MALDKIYMHGRKRCLACGKLKKMMYFRSNYPVGFHHTCLDCEREGASELTASEVLALKRAGKT